MQRTNLICLIAIAFALSFRFAHAEESLAPQGIKICEVTSTTASVWTRVPTTGDAKPARVRVQFWVPNSPAGVSLTRLTDWYTVRKDAGDTVIVPLAGLLARNEYQILVEIETDDPGEREFIEGRFTTAAGEKTADVTFTVVTGQRYNTRDHEDGQQIYVSMLDLKPSFFVHTGDVVYYDKPDPEAKSAELARLKWNRMYSQPRLVKFHRNVPSYFIKDDHDITKNDCWPKQSYGELTWDEGVAIFTEQTAQPETPYRTVRWSKDLQVWFPEGREFRSANNTPDGPAKTILGEKQWAWLEKTLAESDATFKVIVSATPIVGPDRSGKNDNHCNAGFKTEGDKLRKLLADRPNTFVACGDRHWQYASQDPVTGLREYCSGPTTNKHAGGWNQNNYVEDMHKFLRVKGGFLSVNVARNNDEPTITFRHHDVDGKVVHNEQHSAIIE